MINRFKTFLKKIEEKGEELWFVRIAPKSGGKVERWIVSPITTPGSVEKRVLKALEAIIKENKDSEDWDCVYQESKGKIKWMCTLKRSGIITGHKGHVFFKSKGE